MSLSYYLARSDKSVAIFELVNKVEALTTELDRLNKRLETSPDHPFDGIECRDESIKMLERELAAYKKDAEWQPIETAPKEGAWALVYADGAINCAYVEAGKLPEDWTRPANPNVFSASVTHWMPLPAPPDATIAAQEPK